MRSLIVLLALCSTMIAQAQCNRWQQQIKCEIDVELDVSSHRFTGKEKLVYRNNSPDTLREVFFHLYFNAFKPGSEMDVRSRTIKDPDRRVRDRIHHLTPEEQGDLTCSSVLQDGMPTRLEPLGTVLRVTLHRPVLPGKSTALTVDFKGQVPVQIRRSGRDSEEGVAYSMTQWFPKVAAFDERGWHPAPYVGREFYGEWGDYDVRITLDSAYTVAATGVLANAHEIGKGYARKTKAQKRTDGKLTWHFKAPKVHDFAWAADPDYIQSTAQVPDGPLLRFFRKDQPELAENWDQLPGYMVKAFEYANQHFGRYPWPEFSFVQGGDGGMEYPMLTLVTGNRRLGSLVGTSVHEMLHNWYYGVLASDELSYPWIDEGFAEYAGSKVMRHLFPSLNETRAHADARESYLRLAGSEYHEPMSLEADHFETNYGYSATAYSKGEFFLDQLGAVIGDDVLNRGLRRLFRECSFKHPGPVDVQRVMEKESGLQLGWYFNEWINTTRKLDYAIKSVMQQDGATVVTLERKGLMLMPVDVLVQYTDGAASYLNIPLSLMLGGRKENLMGKEWATLAPWQWTNPTYSFTLPVPLDRVREITLDPFERTGDADGGNDTLDLQPGVEGYLER
ncbi:MAG TPA: M1 family metallopeptidase [Flavobacteriales bacterium]|nr:M1 family metallopeptidase [Flavobacteriales bacterium]